MKMVLFSLLVFSVSSFAECLGPNSLRVPVSRAGQMTEERFNLLLDKIEKVYSPVISSYGGKLFIFRNWESEKVNAMSLQVGKTWRISALGGLARHPLVTEDGFTLMTCHEIGHHLGGAPKKRGTLWSSTEGQADYFANLKCLRRVWNDEDNVKIVQSQSVPASVSKACRDQFSRIQDYSICVRSAMAGLSIAKLYQLLRREAIAPSFEVKSPQVVQETFEDHPGTQCRLDTYFAGSLCTSSPLEDIDVLATTELSGTCHKSLGHFVGLRPLCWFKPQE